MRRFFAVLMTLVGLAWLAPAALAGVPHTVRPGETLWSIAAANNFTTRALAAANGLPANASLRIGRRVTIPTVAEAATALRHRPVRTLSRRGPAPMGAYVVRRGDSLSAIAARSGVSLGAVAYMNGLDPRKPLLAGTVIKLPTGAPVSRAVPSSTRRVVPRAAPYAAPGRVTATQVGSIAAAQGVSSSLASAIAWQESGFNNGRVSSANARGVMQILPGTWDWVQRRLSLRPLDPRSPSDNVRAGSLYLGSLLRATGGNAALAAGAYYQGLGSVRRIGMLPDTRRYVRSVMALRGRFRAR